MDQICRLLCHKAARRGIVRQTGTQAIEVRSVAVDELNRHARLGNLPQKLGRAVIARNIGKQAVNLLAYLQTLIDLLERIGVAAHAKFYALNRNALIDDLLLKAVAAFPKVTEKVRPLARCAGQAKHQVDILAAQARGTRIAMVTHGLSLSIHLGAHGFAHAGLTRQGLVHGIDGNAKLGGYVLHGYASAHGVTPL